MRARAACVILSLLAGCHDGPKNGEIGQTIVDACLHWTACVTPPTFATNIELPDCATYSQGQTLPWRNVGVAITPAERDCLAAAGLDCAAALACVSAPAACDQPTWSCDGDTLTFCDAFSGPRAVTRDCAAAGLHCVMLGAQAFCGLGSCDPKSTPPTCAGNAVASCHQEESWDGRLLGGIVGVGEDCADFDATCDNGQCVGNGPACTPSPDKLGCDGDDVLGCDDSGHQERFHCPAGTHCGSTTGPGFSYGCVSDATGKQVVCQIDPTFQQCHGDSLEYCDDHGNETLDCKSLGYAGCDSGRCVPP